MLQIRWKLVFEKVAKRCKKLRVKVWPPLRIEAGQFVVTICALLHYHLPMDHWGRGREQNRMMSRCRVKYGSGPTQQDKMAKYTGPTQDTKDDRVFNNWKKSPCRLLLTVITRTTCETYPSLFRSFSLLLNSLQGEIL